MQKLFVEMAQITIQNVMNLISNSDEVCHVPKVDAALLSWLKFEL